jgi:hypothetical protein
MRVTLHSILRQWFKLQRRFKYHRRININFKGIFDLKGIICQNRKFVLPITTIREYENHKNEKGLQRKLEVFHPKRTLFSLVIRHLITYYLIKKVLHFTFEYISINTTIWINWSKEKKEIFDSWRRRNISKNTCKLLILKTFFSPHHSCYERDDN